MMQLAKFYRVAPGDYKNLHRAISLMRQIVGLEGKKKKYISVQLADLECIGRPLKGNTYIRNYVELWTELSVDAEDDEALAAVMSKIDPNMKELLANVARKYGLLVQKQFSILPKKEVEKMVWEYLKRAGEVYSYMRTLKNADEANMAIIKLIVNLHGMETKKSTASIDLSENGIKPIMKAVKEKFPDAAIKMPGIVPRKKAEKKDAAE